MDYILHANDIIMCLYLAAIFPLLVELKYSMKKTVIVLGGYIAIAFPAYLQLVTMINNRGLAAAIAFSIPSLIICFFLSKYKGARFVFTFCTVDLMGFFALAIATSISFLFDNNPLVIFIVLNIEYIGLLLLVIKYRKSYIVIQQEITKGWVSFAIVSILFYVMMYMITSYPEPMRVRREYIPVVYVFMIMIAFCYVVIYQTVMKDIAIYDEQKEKQLLKTKIELQESQLELEEMYVKLAYTDILTGLKNRTAFEEKKTKIIRNPEKYNQIACLMLDLNNLKITNDNFGHDKGDELIRNFSSIIRETIDLTHAIYRIGGDEFIALFLNIECSEVEKQIAKLRRRVSEENLVNPLKISFAGGLSCIEKDDIHDIDSLISCADRRMYEDKKIIKGVEE